MRKQCVRVVTNKYLINFHAMKIGAQRKLGGSPKRNDFDSNEMKATFEKPVSSATQKRVLLLS